MKLKPFLIVAILTILAGGCAAFPGAAADSALQASGVVEATEVMLAAELSGRIVALSFAQGDPVQAGDVVFRLDDTLLQAQRAAAQAALDAAQKGVQTAQAGLEAAQAQHDIVLSAALAAEQPARTDIWKQSTPADFDLPLWYFDADERYRSTQSALESARATLDAAQENLAGLKTRAGSARFLDAEQRLSDARVTLQLAQGLLDGTNGAIDGQSMRDDAQDSYDIAKADLSNAQKAYDDALTTEGAQDVFDARAKVAVAQERFDLAQDALRAFQTGARDPQVLVAARAVDQAGATLDQAGTLVDQAQANLSLIDAQIEKLTVRAPQSGVILTQSVQVGEVLQAGVPALTIGRLETLKVTVYIPEDQYGVLRVGDTASLVSDSFPGQTFTATVTRIADQAEYTPQNVQTKEGRQTTVYAVELSADNPDGKLKPGMPVDVTFSSQAGS